MSYHNQYSHEQYGIPDYQPERPRQQQRMMPPGGQGRRPQQPQYGGPDRGMRFPVRPQQSYAPPSQRAARSTENLYDGSDYGQPEGDQWPLPARPVPQQSQPPPRSKLPVPGGGRGPPPQRPQRPDAAQQIRDPPRPSQPQDAPRVAPANRQYHPPPPPPIPQQAQHSHHGSGEWTGDGYSIAGAPSFLNAYPSPQQIQQQQQAQAAANRARPPLGPPPSARRGPASYYPQMAPVHPIVEESDSVRGSVRNGSIAGSFASSNAIPIGVPDYYLENRNSSGSNLRTPDYRDSAPSMRSGMSMPDYYLENRDSDVPSVPDLNRRSEGRSLSEYESDTPNIGDEPMPAPPEPLRMGGKDPRREEEERYREREEASPEPATLVRQASLGKRSKPTLTTVKSGDRLRKDSASEGLSSLPSQQRQAVAGAGAGTQEAKLSEVPKVKGPHPTDTGNRLDPNIDVPAPPYKQRANESRESTRTPSSGILSSGTGFLDSSSSESEKSVKKARSKEIFGGAASKEMLGVPLPKAERERTRSRSPLAPADPRAEVLKGLEGGGALSRQDAEKSLKQPSSGMSELRAGKRRPPRLNVDAVRDAEKRGSLTSLPDLIKRATKLASNLDRGRTASRLGMSEWLGNGSGEDLEKHRSGMSGNEYRRSNGSISDILASFPPPALGTPPGSRGEMRRSLTNWSSNLRHSAMLPSDSDGASQARRKQKKRCCGMPLWLFLLLLVLLVLLVAAAIIVPVVLIVVPKQDNNGSGSGSSALDTCQRQVTCQNGGATVVSSDGGCRCICVNGFTGTTCGQQSSGACTSTAVGSTNDATVGNDIPRLLQGAQSNFSIPLDGETVLGLFSSNDMSCQAENALVTFSNVQQRGLLPLVVREPTPTLQIRQATTTAQDSVATSNGIIFESGSPTTTGGSQSSTSATASAGSSATSSSGSSTDSGSLDFARVAVLYVFQASGQLGTATTAQTNLASYFTSGQTSTGQTINAANVSLGSGFTCDLRGHSLSLANGTTVGGSS